MWMRRSVGLACESYAKGHAACGERCALRMLTAALWNSGAVPHVREALFTKAC